MQDKAIRQSKHMRYFSTLAGPLTALPRKTPYSVKFKRLSSYDKLIYRGWAKFIASLTFILVMIFAAVLFQPGHWIITQQPDSSLYAANFIILVCLFALQLFVIISTLSASRSTLVASNPLPVRAPRGLEVAFVTTRAPGEPVELVRNTLEAALRVRYKSGKVDVWLLDETKSPELKAMCEQLGVHYFSRKGVHHWNTPKASNIAIRKLLLNIRYRWNVPKDKRIVAPNRFLAAKTKHGNFNSWMRYLKRRGYGYDLLAGVDTDHVPEPNFLERTLGYFRDPNIAYVVGPQVYGNYGHGLNELVTRWAESQASFFQSTIQRAGNHSRSPMFVGTNYVIRFKALEQIGGFQPCITEDMATGLAIHAAKNPETGKQWQSVYTPDVLAVGEGPASWGPFFAQQWRWAAGTFDTLRRSVWRSFFHIRPRAMLHYALILSYYPTVALTWILAIISSMLYLTTGATAVLAPWGTFVALYMMGLVMQLSLYFWNRRYNVSPHEPAGSYGVAGMAISALTAPIYFSALIRIVLGKKPNFVVTAKGGDQNLDNMSVFKSHYLWALILAGGIAYGMTRQHGHPAMLVWSVCLMVICLTPVAIASALHIQAFLRNASESLHLRINGESKHE